MKANKTMKTFSMIVMILAVTSVGMVSAATNGTLVLQGNVPAILEITVNAEPNSSSLDLSIDAANVKVASVTERSNKKAGYTVTLESANAAANNASSGVFVSTDPLSTDSLNYSLTYGGNPVTFTNGSAIISNTSSKTTGAGDTKDVAISYNGATDFPYEGTYGDTLTFTIAAK